MQNLPFSFFNGPPLPNQMNNSFDSVSNLDNFSKIKRKHESCFGSLTKPIPIIPFFSQALIKKYPINQASNIKSSSIFKSNDRTIKPYNFPIQNFNTQKNQPKVIVRNFNSNSAPNLLSNTLNKVSEVLKKKDETISLEQEKFCKICFENIETKVSGKLISPCKCTGTVRFIHEECLKTWQVSQQQDIKNAECELCGFKYQMNFKMGWKFYPRQALDDGILNFISSLCLLILITTLLSIIVIFAIQLNQPDGIFSRDDSSEGSGGAYKLGVLVSCCVICFILCLLLFLTLKEACFISQINKWSILNYLPGEKSSPKYIQPQLKNLTTPVKIFPKRSNSDDINMRATPYSFAKKTKQFQTKIIKIRITDYNNNGNSNNENRQTTTKKITEEKTQTKGLFQMELKDYQKDLINFSNNDFSDKDLSVKSFNFEKIDKEYNKNIITFSNNSSDKNMRNDKNHLKSDLLRLSSINSSTSSLDLKFALEEQYIKNMPKDYLNFTYNKEKTVEVLLNQNIQEKKKGSILMDFLKRKELNTKKAIYWGVRKNFLHFKKQMVSNEEKSDEKSKIGNSSSSKRSKKK